LRQGIQIIWAIWDEFNEMLGHFRIYPTHCTAVFGNYNSSFWTVIFLHTIWASFSALASNLELSGLGLGPLASASRCLASLTSLALTRKM